MAESPKTRSALEGAQLGASFTAFQHQGPCFLGISQHKCAPSLRSAKLSNLFRLMLSSLLCSNSHLKPRFEPSSPQTFCSVASLIHPSLSHKCSEFLRSQPHQAMSHLGKKTFDVESDIPDLSGKVILVTGG
jgi:hypothetical protein